MAKKRIQDNDVLKDLMSYTDSVFRICLGFSKNPWDAEDLMQEVYLKTFREIRSLKNFDRRKEWLLRIAKNTCLNYVKKKRLNRFLFLNLSEYSVEQNNPEFQTIQSEQHHILKGIISRLPKKHREIFILKEYGHLSYQEIALVLGIKKGTVRSRLNRARRSIMIKLREANYAE